MAVKKRVSVFELKIEGEARRRPIFTFSQQKEKEKPAAGENNFVKKIRLFTTMLSILRDSKGICLFFKVKKPSPRL